MLANRVEFVGVYTRKGGLQRTYSYRVTVTRMSGGFLWEGQVRFMGETKGTPRGLLKSDSIAHARQRAEQIVQDSIESLSGVDE